MMILASASQHMRKKPLDSPSYNNSTSRRGESGPPGKNSTNKLLCNAKLKETSLETTTTIIDTTTGKKQTKKKVSFSGTGDDGDDPSSCTSISIESSTR